MSIRTIFETFEQVSQTPGRNAKIALIDNLVRLQPNQHSLKENQETWNNSELLKQVIQYTYNPFWVYRITVNIKEFTPSDENLSDNLSDAVWRSFVELLTDLRTRSSEISTLKICIKDLISRRDALFQKYLCQILNRDLKIGIQSWNRWFPGLIPAEPFMLCDKWEGETLEGNWIAEPKFDGYRAAIVVDSEGNCEAISRGMKEFWNWEHIAKEIKASGIRDVVFDGEFFAGSWSKTSSICKTQSTHPDRLELKYYIFDALTPEEWKVTKCKRTLRERSATLDAMFATGALYENLTYLEIVGGPIITEQSDIQMSADEYYSKGYEGVVVKNLDSPYIFDRSSFWLKIKPENDADLTITGVEEGKGRHVGRLGAFRVEGKATYKKQNYNVVAMVGGGLSDIQRTEFWKQHQEGKLVGTVIEVVFQDVTSDNLDSTAVYSLRFPRFKRVRLDKTK